MLARTTWLPVLTFLAALTGVAACSGGDESGAAAPTTPPTTTGPTYHKDVAPILQKSCQGCHRPGDIAPFGLTSYEEAKATAAMIVTETKERRMPPWGAHETDECTPRYGWKEDLRLSEAEIKTLEDWKAAGTPEGDPKDAPPPFDPPGRELQDKDMELTPQDAHVTSGDADQFRCFILDPKLTEPAALNGWAFLPGNAKVVHHILLFADPKGASAAKDEADGVVDGAYDCFGGGGFAGASLVAGWAPGGIPSNLPANIGVPFEAGTKLVMQIHYHPAGATADPDLTRVQLRFSDTKPEYYLKTSLIGNFPKTLANGDGLLPGPNDGPEGAEFHVPAGAADHTESMQFTLPAMINGKPTPKLYVYGVGAHMHLVGVDEKISIDHAGDAEPKEECLLHEPQWSFSWQRGYFYDAAIEELPLLLPGDKLKIRCTYNNTLENEALAKALKDENEPSPVEVRLGESTLEEMCLTDLRLLTKAN